jgi:hypothetical protein
MIMVRRYGSLGDVSRHVAHVLQLASPAVADVHVRRHRGLIPLRYDEISAADMMALCAAVEADLDAVGRELESEELALV